MADLGWREAVIHVLQNSKAPMHYTEIAETIAEEGLRRDLGANPAVQVSVLFTNSFKNEGRNSPFRRVSRGYYSLAENQQRVRQTQPVEEEVEAESEVGLIHAFGMFWSRSNVLWDTAKLKLLGKQQAGSDPVNFCDQIGVYILYDGRTIVYVGRAIDQPLGTRLRQHTIDRLNGRWDRFSWFGVKQVGSEGGLKPSSGFSISAETLIITMEALLIEGLEPPQNRKRGDEFRAIEFIQDVDPDIRRKRQAQMLDEMKSRL